MPANPFLPSILADPGDDGIRLVFADWLEENGYPERAAFVRLQVESAAIWPGPVLPVPGVGDGPTPQDRERWLDLMRRQQALLDSQGAALEPELPAGPWAPKVPAFYLGLAPVLFPAVRMPGVVDGYDAIGGVSVGLRRGLVAGISCTIRDWYGTDGTDGAGPALVATCPLEAVHLNRRC
jgi:uncharacterized protein (TIGR02996 family)